MFWILTCGAVALALAGVFGGNGIRGRARALVMAALPVGLATLVVASERGAIVDGVLSALALGVMLVVANRIAPPRGELDDDRP